nr:hypothetical protein [Tanacetum cinerariifolium]
CTDGTNEDKLSPSWHGHVRVTQEGFVTGGLLLSIALKY